MKRCYEGSILTINRKTFSQPKTFAIFQTMTTTPQDVQVPNLSWDTHRIRISGLVDKPCEFFVDELVKTFPSVSVDVTLKCNGILHHPDLKGNFRGVKLWDVLQHVGVQRNRAKSVRFQGADDEEYYTTVPFDRIVDSNDIILAYDLNGKRIPPEHGFPVRVVVGREASKAVKWVQLIEVCADEAK